MAIGGAITRADGVTLVIVEKDYRDARGIMRRVAVPFDRARPEEGIPVDIFDILDEYYSDTPISFRQALYHSLWQRRLILPEDFNRRDAKTAYRQALQTALARDATDAIRYLEDNTTNA